MDKNQVLSTIKLVREFSKKRKFDQSVDLIITLKNLNLKKPEENVDLFVTLPHSRGKQLRLCAFVDDNLQKKAKEVFGNTINVKEFSKFQDPKQGKKLASDYDMFLAQANLMGQVATSFGKLLGPKGKMPNPKAGAIIVQGADLELLSKKFTKLVRLQTKKELIIKSSIGKESMKDDELAENIVTSYNSVIHSLPQEESNVKEVMIKLSMSPRIKLGESKEQVEAHLHSLKKYQKKEKKKATEKPKVTKKVKKNEQA